MLSEVNYLIMVNDDGQIFIVNKFRRTEIDLSRFERKSFVLPLFCCNGYPSNVVR